MEGERNKVASVMCETELRRRREKEEGAVSERQSCRYFISD